MYLAFLSSPQLMVLLLIIVILFGSTRLPGLMRNLGRSAVEFKKGLKEGVDDPTDPSENDPKS